MSEAGFDAVTFRDAVSAIVPQIGPVGTTCGGCMGRGVMTMHSPAGDEHAAWEAQWAADSSWMPAGVTPQIPIVGFFGPFSPMLPVPVTDPVAVRPEPRKWALPLMDPCRGSVRVPYHGDGSPERFDGDYGGGRWVPLGVTGYEVRCWADGSGSDGDGYFPVARVQYRPKNSSRLPEEFVKGGQSEDPC